MVGPPAHIVYPLPKEPASIFGKKWEWFETPHLAVFFLTGQICSNVEFWVRKYKAAKKHSQENINPENT